MTTDLDKRTKRQSLFAIATGMLVFILCLAMLAGCGRKADLDVPGTDPTPRRQANDPTTPPNEDTPPPAPERRFFLDALIE